MGMALSESLDLEVRTISNTEDAFWASSVFHKNHPCGRTKGQSGYCSFQCKYCSSIGVNFIPCGSSKFYALPVKIALQQQCGCYFVHLLFPAAARRITSKSACWAIVVVKRSSQNSISVCGKRSLIVSVISRILAASGLRCRQCAAAVLSAVWGCHTEPLSWKAPPASSCARKTAIPWAKNPRGSLTATPISNRAYIKGVILCNSYALAFMAEAKISGAFINASFSLPASLARPGQERAFRRLCRP